MDRSEGRVGRGGRRDMVGCYLRFGVLFCGGGPYGPLFLRSARSPAFV